MMWSIFLQIIAGIAGLFLADKFISGVEFNGPIFLFPQNQEQLHDFLGTLVFVGAFLGILNGIVKPVLNTIAFPLRMLTLNLFSLAIAVFMVFITDTIFTELTISGVIALFWTTLIVWGLSLILTKWLPSKK